MNEYVTDTHSLLWYLTDSPLLGKNASAVFDDSSDGVALIYVPSIVLAELYYSNVKYKFMADFSHEFQKIKQSSQFILMSFEAEDVLDFDNDSDVKEMHDRMIVGVARRLSIPLLTKDINITESNLVKIIW
jgi:PIN domain nuclease of toxin-antitoxin system